MNIYINTVSGRESVVYKPEAILFRLQYAKYCTRVNQVVFFYFVSKLFEIAFVGRI